MDMPSSMFCVRWLLLNRQESSEDSQPLETQNLISRFRANLVVAGVEPFEEDTWSQLIIGNTQFLVSWRIWLRRNESIGCGASGKYGESHKRLIEYNQGFHSALVCILNAKVGGRCERCQVICVDQDTGTKTKAPLLALSACRSGKVGPNRTYLLLHPRAQCGVHHASIDNAFGLLNVCVCLCDLFISSSWPLECTLAASFRWTPPLPGLSLSALLYCTQLQIPPCDCIVWIFICICISTVKTFKTFSRWQSPRKEGFLCMYILLIQATCFVSQKLNHWQCTNKSL